MSAPAPQRQRVDAGASGLTTNEHYARKHEIPDDINNAIPGVAMRIRQAMGQGSNRTFGRTESSPAVFGQYGGTSSSLAPVYLTDAEAQARAWEAIQRESMRSRELAPFASGSSLGAADAEDRLNLSPRRGAAARNTDSSPDRMQGCRLRFGKDGEVELLEGTAAASRTSNVYAPIGTMVPGKKRGAEDDPNVAGDVDADGFSDTATEVDEDEAVHEDGMPGMTHGHSGSTINDDFPSVFNSPAISQPELFGIQPSAAKPSGTMGPPALPSAGRQLGRATRGLPGRRLAKTVSAPVVFGQWGMDVDMQDGEQQPPREDGFDVSEWSKEQF